MAISKRFEITPPEASPSSAFGKICLAFVLFECRKTGFYTLPRRGLQLLFNRAGGPATSRQLKSLVKDGWLHQTVDNTISEAFIYSPGHRLRQDDELFANWTTIALSLFGYNGLIKPFRDSAGWGIGCLGPNGVYLLALLVRSDSRHRKQELDLLCEWIMSKDRVRVYLKKLVEGKIVTKSESGYQIHESWKENLQIFIDSSPSGTQRQHTVENRVKAERYFYIHIARKRKLTKNERDELLLLECVRCGGKSTEMEHWPPKKFGGYDNCHLVWSICEDCNDDTRAFIRSLPKTNFRPAIEAYFAANVDPIDIVRASLHVHLGKFYDAADRWNKRTEIAATRRGKRAAIAADLRDKHAAIEAIRRPVELWLRLEKDDLITVKRPKLSKPRKRGTRLIKGANPLARGTSRLKY